MELLPKDIMERLPKLGETAEQQDSLVLVRFFFPDLDWSWFGIEFDGTDIFFEYVFGLEGELGQFSLKELLSNPAGFYEPIERDVDFKPLRLSEIRELWQR